MRAIFAYVLSLVLTLSGFVLAEAKGASHDIGMEIVICSGVGMKTITIGPDGEPIETAEVCPEGHSIFAADFALPELPRPSWQMSALVVPERLSHVHPRGELTPSARGPPALV